MQSLSAKFVFERSTKRTYRFVEVDQNNEVAADPIVGTIYIRKSAFGHGDHRDEAPQSITLTITQG